MEDFTPRQIALFVVAMLIAGALTAWGTKTVLERYVLFDPNDPITKQGDLAPAQIGPSLVDASGDRQFIALGESGRLLTGFSRGKVGHCDHAHRQNRKNHSIAYSLAIVRPCRVADHQLAPG